MIRFAHGPKAGWTALAAKFLAEGRSKSGVCLAIFLLQPALVLEIDPLGHWNTEKKENFKLVTSGDSQRQRGALGVGSQKIN